MRLLLSIPSLERGGAERQFAALAAGLAARGHEVLAVSLGSVGPSAGPLAAELGGARLLSLGKTSRRDGPRVALALAGLLKREQPAVHCAFLPSCCVLGGLLQSFFPATRLVMCLRASRLEGLGVAARLLLGLEARLSRRAALVLANSRAGMADAKSRGFPPQCLRLLENGVDTERFRPAPELGAPLRSQWQPEPGGRLVGLVARLHPMKDHGTFLEAVAILAARRPELRFVCVGGGPEGLLRELKARAEGLGLASRLTWAGPRADMEAVYNALDLLCLSSAYGEGFPNVLAEAMACGVPCVATTAGDSAEVLGEQGLTVPPGDPAGLADGLERGLARLEREAAGWGRACRQRVLANYSIARMLDAAEGYFSTL